jgi:hypothetical protein
VTATTLRRSAHGLDSGADTDGWRQHGACHDAQYDPDWWTSPSYTELGRATWVCNRVCPVRRTCLAWARANTQQCDAAVYGGVYFTSAHGKTVRQADKQPLAIPPGPRHRLAWGSLTRSRIQPLVDAGYTDAVIACLLGTRREVIAKTRHRLGIPTAVPQ